MTIDHGLKTRKAVVLLFNCFFGFCVSKATCLGSGRFLAFLDLDPRGKISTKNCKKNLFYSQNLNLNN